MFHRRPHHHGPHHPPHHGPHHEHGFPPPHHHGGDRWGAPLPDATDQELLNAIFLDEPEKAAAVFRLFQGCPPEISAIASIVLRLSEQVDSLRREIMEGKELQASVPGGIEHNQT